MDAPFCGILTASFVACGARGPRTHGVQGLSVWGGAFCVPPHRPFSHCTFFPPQVFFSFFLAFEASVRTGELVLRLRDECRGQTAMECQIPSAAPGTPQNAL